MPNFEELKLGTEIYFNILEIMAEVGSILCNMIYVFWPQKTNKKTKHQTHLSANTSSTRKIAAPALVWMWIS